MIKKWENYNKSKLIAIILVFAIMMISVRGTTIFGGSDETQPTVVNTSIEDTSTKESTVIDKAELIDAINKQKGLGSFDSTDELAGFKDQKEKETFIKTMKEDRRYTLFYLSEINQNLALDEGIDIFVGSEFGEDDIILNEEVIFVIHNNSNVPRDVHIQISELDEMVFSVEANSICYSVDSIEGILQLELEEKRTENSVNSSIDNPDTSLTIGETAEPEIALKCAPTPNIKCKPTQTPVPPCKPTQTPVPPCKPTQTPVPPCKPTQTPVPPCKPTKTPVPTATPEPIILEPKISKTAIRDLDDLGMYDVNLSVSGDDQEELKTNPVDVVVVLDVSNSMYWSMENSTLEATNGEPDHYNDDRSRWYALQLALKTMVDTVLDVHGSKISIVIYSGNISNKEYLILNQQSSNNNGTGWYTDKSVVNQLYFSKDSNSTVPTIKLLDLRKDEGGTNGKAGFTGAKEQLSKVTSSTNAKCVVYMSDGVANRYFNENGNIVTTGGTQIAGAAAIPEAKSIVSQYGASIYTIGLGAGLTSNPVVQGYLMNPSGDNKYNVSYTQADKSSDLSKLFGELAVIFTHKVNNVTVEDQVSEFVNPMLVNGYPQFTLLKNGIGNDTGTLLEPYKFIANTVHYKDANDNEILTYAVDQKIIEWKVGTTLGSDETYTLSYPVLVNDKAIYYQEGYEGKSNCNQADLSTGTHSGEFGYHSNDHATVTYNGGQKKEFPHPVVKPLPDATLEISKILSSEGRSPDNLRFIFEVKINDKKYSGDVNINDSPTSIKAVDGQIVLHAGEVAAIKHLKADDTYSVEEIGIVENKYYESELVKTEQIVTPKDGSIEGLNITLPSDSADVETLIAGKMSVAEAKKIADVKLTFTNKITYIKGSITVLKSLVDKENNPKEDKLDTNTFIFELCYTNGLKELIGTTCYGSITILKGDTGNEEIKDSSGESGPKYSFVFANLPIGTYLIKEVNHMRYDLVSIDKNGVVTLTKQEKNQTVCVKNKKGRENYFSDSAVAVNCGKFISSKEVVFVKKEED